MPFDKELDVVLATVRDAGQLILASYDRFVAIPDARADITTEADREGQEKIVKLLRRRFPADAICAEEKTPSLEGVPSTGRRQWVIDPIDGTRGFAMKNGEFSIMVGFVVEGQVQLGVVSEPALKRLTFAIRGGGCWKRDADGQPMRCQVTGTTSLAEATLTQSRSKNPAVPTKEVQAIQPGRVVETYSAGIKLALVARGEVDLYVNYYPSFSDWDICAGHILVSEAGGQVTGLKGEEIRYGLPGAVQSHGLLATNGRLHAAALERLTRAQ